MFIKIILLLFLLTDLSASIIVYEEEFSGTRPLGMGSAFVAVSDDINAISYNPAGLCQIKYNQLGLMYSPVYLDKDNTFRFFKSYVNFVYPVARYNVIGIDWLHTGFADTTIGSYGVPELEFAEEKVNTAYSTRISEKLLFGISLKLLYTSAYLDNELEGSAIGYGMNLGLMYLVSERFKIGTTFYNVFPSFKNFKNWGLIYHYNDGTETIKYPPSIRIGTSLEPVENLLLSLDFIDPLCFGTEYWFHNLIGIRAGIRKNFNPSSSLGISFGFSIRYKIGQIDYAFNYTPSLPITHNLGLSATWGYQAYLVDVLSVDIKEIFPSLYKSYEKQDIVRVVLKSKSKNLLKTKIGFYVDKIMKRPTEKEITLKPGVVTELKLPAVFSEDITEIKDDKVVSGDIILSYRVEERESKDISSHKFTLYSRNAFIWDDMDKIASFVTPQDDKIKEFTRNVLHNFKIAGEPVISKNFHRAMLIFQALGAYGITYVPDPTNPYGKAKSSIDYIQYPQETLKIKTGDCDDCSVLYASCLESIGIPTAFIITPDHIFIMFDAGINSDEAKEIFKNEELFIDIDGRVWIPVETTMYGKQFFDAIKEGVRSCKIELLSDRKDALNIVDVEEAWEKYPSAVIKEKQWKLSSIDSKKMEEIMYNDAKFYISLKEGDDFTDLINKLRSSPNDAKLNNKAGMYFGKYGIFNIAKRYFEQAIKLNPQWASPYNNLGNLYYLAGENEKAIAEYEKALKLSPGDPEIIQNLNTAKAEK